MCEKVMRVDSFDIEMNMYRNIRTDRDRYSFIAGRIYRRCSDNVRGTIVISEDSVRFEPMVRHFTAEETELAIDGCLTDDDIIRLSHKLPMDEVIQHQTLGRKALRALKHELDWTLVCLYQDMTPEIVREFRDFVDWEAILKWQGMDLIQKIRSDAIEEQR